MTASELAVRGIAALAILLAGRRLFWLFVAVTGFLVGFEAAVGLLPGASRALVWLLALGAGALGAAAAVGLQYVAAALAGLAAGAWVAMPFAASLAAPWLPFAAGVLGAALMLLAFDPALIALSALTGSWALVSLLGLAGAPELLGWLGLAAVGMLVQASVFEPVRPAAPRD